MGTLKAASAAGLLAFQLICCTKTTSMTSRPLSIDTAQVFPSHIPTPTNTPVSLPTPTKGETSTPLSTLSDMDTRIKVMQYLSNNGNCRLPCLWGITPGQTDGQNAMIILFPLSGYSDYPFYESDGGYISPHFSIDNVILYTSISYKTDNNNQVNKIFFHANSFSSESGDIFGSKEYNDQMKYYLLMNILQEYGQPSSVSIYTRGDRGSLGLWGMFYLLLLYPNQGILIEYSTMAYFSGNNVLGCPSNFIFTMGLYPSGNPDLFNQSIQQDLPSMLPLFIPLEKTTSLTVTEFYSIYQKPTSQCIATPINLWPIMAPR